MIRLALVMMMMCFGLGVHAQTVFDYSQAKRASKEYNQGKLADALVRQQDLINKGVALGEMYNNQGLVYQKEGAYDEAISYFKKASKKLTGKKKADALYNLGSSYLAKQQLEKAKEVYIDSLTINPQDVDAKQNLEAVLSMLNPQTQPPPPTEDDQKDESDDPNDPPPPPPEQDPEEQKEDELDQRRQDEQKQDKHRKEDANQLLNKLDQKEKEARNKMRQKEQPNQPNVEFDW